MPMLRIINGIDENREMELTEGSEFSMGRGKNVSFCLNDPSVSRIHAIVFTSENTFTIKDQNSNNGVWINGKKVSSHDLIDGDQITIGNTVLLFSYDMSVDSSESSSVIIMPDQPGIDPDKSIVMDVEEFNLMSRQLTGEFTQGSDSSATHKNYRKLQAMLKISNAVANIFEIKELCNELMNIIFSETKATRGFIMLYDENKKLVPMSVKKKNIRDKAITISNTIISTVVGQKKALLSSDLMNDERFASGLSIIANQIRSCMCAPLLYHDEVLGVIHIDSNITANIFGSDALEFLVAIANQAAVCIKNAFLVKKITEEENKRSKLSQYFPPAQVELLMKDGANISLGGKTEQVTIIFCDIRNFTSISEGMDALEVMNFLNEFFSIMTEIIFNHDGMVDNFMGDCIMSVFGGPFYHENDTERAVKAAIEMQLAQKELNKKFESEGRQAFGIGIGIHSGSVSRGNIGSPQLKKYTVIGNNVNVTSRLCSLAKATEILVSSQTKATLPEDIRLKEQKPVKVKNVSEPLVPYKVIY